MRFDQKIRKQIFLKVSAIGLEIHNSFLGKANRVGAAKPYLLKYTPTREGDLIVHVIGNFIVGGSSQLVVDIIERTSDKYRHRVIVPKIPEPLLYKPLDIKSFSIYEIGLLYEYLKWERPAIVHIHYFVKESIRFAEGALWYYSIFKVCEELHIPVIQNVNIPTAPYNNNCVVHNVFVSEFVKNNFGNEGVESSVIYPGSDFNHFENLQAENLPPKVIGMVYRLDRDKLSADSIEVFIKAVNLDSEIHCLIVGGGFFLEYYKQRVSEEGLKKNFTFTGYVSYKSLPSYYKKMSLFVAPVHDESFGQVTPFAMNMGLAVTGYDVGALKEILGYEDTLVAPGDIKKLAEVIVELASSDEKRISFGKRNQQRAKNFSVEEMIENYVALYQSIA